MINEVKLSGVRVVPPLWKRDRCQFSGVLKTENDEATYLLDEPIVAGPWKWDVGNDQHFRYSHLYHEYLQIFMGVPSLRGKLASRQKFCRRR